MPTSVPPKAMFYCVKAAFDSADKTSNAEWSICYSQQQQKLMLSVHFDQSEPIKPGGPLISTLDQDTLNELLEFLANVKMRMGTPG